MVSTVSGNSSLLTIVLPLKGRPEYTFRWLHFANCSKFPFKVIIADGGADAIVSEVLSVPSNYPNLDYQYVKYAFDATYTHFYRKMVDALSRVETPFVAMMDDDSFHIPVGLSKAVAFLVDHPEYSTCRGQHLDFRIVARPDWAPSVLHGASIEIDGDYFDKSQSIWRSFEAESGLDRIVDWSSTMNIMYYNVHRAEALREAWNFIRDTDLIDLFMVDLSIALFSLVRGKTKVLEHPFMLRQQNSPSSASKDAVRRADILDRMFLEEWTRHLNRLIEAIACIACDDAGVTRAEALDRVRGSLKEHYADRLYTYLEQRRAMRREAGATTIPVREFTKASDVHPGVQPLFDFLLSEPAYWPLGTASADRQAV